MGGMSSAAAYQITPTRQRRMRMDKSRRPLRPSTLAVNRMQQPHSDYQHRKQDQRLYGPDALTPQELGPIDHHEAAIGEEKGDAKVCSERMALDKCPQGHGIILPVHKEQALTPERFATCVT